MKKYFIVPLFVLFILQVNAQRNSGKFKVVFNDGSTKIVRGRIEYVAHKDSADKDVLICSKQVITPAQTKSVTWLGSYDSLPGMASEDKHFWLFKTIKGPISAFAALPNGRGIKYLEKDGLRVPFSFENLWPLFKDDSSLYKRYGRSLKVFVWQRSHPGAALTGASLLTATIVGLSIGALFSAPPFPALIGVTVLTTTTVLIAVRASRLYPLEAINEYNYLHEK